MKIQTVKMRLYGEDVDVTMYSANGKEWVRFMVVGSWAGPQDTSAAGKDMCVQLFGDGSFTITKQKLIPAETLKDERKLDVMLDLALNAIEDALMLDTMSLSSGSNWVGHDSADMDYLMTDEERAIISGAMQNTTATLSFGVGVFSIGPQKLAKDGKTYVVPIYANVPKGKSFSKDDIKTVLARFGYNEEPVSYMYHEYGRDYANMAGWDGLIQATFSTEEEG